MRKKSLLELNCTSQTVSMSLPEWLVEEMDAVCATKDISRSSFCKKAIKKMLLSDELENAQYWERRYYASQNLHNEKN